MKKESTIDKKIKEELNKNVNFISELESLKAILTKKERDILNMTYKERLEAKILRKSEMLK